MMNQDLAYVQDLTYFRLIYLEFIYFNVKGCSDWKAKGTCQKDVFNNVRHIIWQKNE